MLWQPFKTRKLCKEFYFEIPALVQLIALATIATLRIPIDQWGLFGQVLYWTIHVASVVYLIPWIAATVIVSMAYGYGKATGEEWL